MPHTAGCEYETGLVGAHRLPRAGSGGDPGLHGAAAEKGWRQAQVTSTVRPSMSMNELLRWQWQGYSRYHQSRANLLIHIVAVPLFLGGTIALLLAVAELSLIACALAVGCIVVAIAFQGHGHRLEPVPPEPFSGPVNFVARVLLEQWVTFPRFVLSGAWRAALRGHREP